MENRVILRTISNLSFAGKLAKDVIIDNNKGVTLKMSDDCNIRMWFPYEDVECVLLPDGQKIDGGSSLQESNL